MDNLLDKKAQTKQHARLRDDTPKRFSEKEYKDRQKFIKDFGICQVCDTTKDLDTPHHTLQGAKKDDRSLICICISCHYTLHSNGYETLKKSKTELVAIGFSNNELYNKYKEK